MKNFLDMYQKVWQDGIPIIARGATCIELENARINITSPFTSFHERKFNLQYLKKEFLWYLSGDPYNDMITDHAQMWKDLAQPDGTFFSNYGQYWFGDQNGFEFVVNELNRDQDSRRAVIPMLRANHMFASNKDVVCTYGIGFRVRNNKLNMTVHMRSNDVIWGLTNDVPCFWWLREMIATKLNLDIGTYIHLADSLHVYERHYPMIQKIINAGEDGYFEVSCPPITDTEDLIWGEFNSDFGRWLNA